MKVKKPDQGSANIGDSSGLARLIYYDGAEEVPHHYHDLEDPVVDRVHGIDTAVAFEQHQQDAAGAIARFPSHPEGELKTATFCRAGTSRAVVAPSTCAAANTSSCSDAARRAVASAAVGAQAQAPCSRCSSNSPTKHDMMIDEAPP